MNLIGFIVSPLSDTTSIFVGLLSVVLALASILIGIQIATRVKGKLKCTIIFLILAIAVILAREILILAGVIYPNFINGIMRILTVLFILLAALCMKQMINGIDNHFGRREKIVRRREVVVRKREKKAGRREVAAGKREKALRRK